MQLNSETILIVGAIIALVSGLIISWFLHDRDLQENEEKREEIKQKEEFPELIIEFTEPGSFASCQQTLTLGLGVGIILFLVFLFLVALFT
jgi:hypothetical protein